MVLLLLIHCLLLLQLWESVIVLCFAVRYFISFLVFVTILMGKRKLVALLSLSFWCLVIVAHLCLVCKTFLNPTAWYIMVVACKYMSILNELQLLTVKLYKNSNFTNDHYIYISTTLRVLAINTRQKLILLHKTMSKSKERHIYYLPWIIKPIRFTLPVLPFSTLCICMWFY